MKAAIASTLALAISCSIIPVAHADSGDLAHQVYGAAARDGVSLSHVFVLTRGGDVTLVGWVPESGQRVLAEQSAMRVQGVTSVDNWLSSGYGRTR
jgi:hypothetical protein